MFQHCFDGHGVARADGFEQRDFDQDFFRGGVAEAAFAIGQHFEDAREGVDVDALRLFREAPGFVLGNLEHPQVAAGDDENEEVAEMREQVGEEAGEVFAAAGEVVQFAQRRLGLAVEDGLGDGDDLGLRGEAEHREDVGFLNAVAAEADELVERGLGVAHAAVRTARDGLEGGVIDLHLFFFGDLLEVADDERGGDAAEIEALAAGENGGQNLLRIGGGEEEFHMRGRFLEGLQQRVERGRREHVDFVDDVDFELRRGGRKLGGLAEVAHLLDAVVARAVDFEDVERAAFGDFLAARVGLVDVHLGAAGAVQAFGEDARDGGFARAARAAEEVGVGDAMGGDGVGKGLGDVLLPDDVAETLRPIFSGDDLIGHAADDGGGTGWYEEENLRAHRR